MTELTLFSFVNDITFGKKYIYDETNDGIYNQTIVNLALSQYRDTVLIANQMNINTSYITNKQHFDFCYYLIPKYKRFASWYKKEKTESYDYTSAISRKYNISNKKALEYAKLLSDEELEEVKNIFGSKEDKNE